MGSVERGLLRQGLRYSLGLRLVVAAAASFAALLLDTPREPVPAAAMVLLLNAWNVYYAVRTLRGAPRWLIPADVAVVCAVCLLQVWPAPTDVGSGSTIWVSAAAAIIVVTYPWQLGTRALAIATVAVMLADIGGAAIANPDGWLAGLGFASIPIRLWLVAEVALSWSLYRLVRRSARAADQLVVRGERTRREATIASARRMDEREYLAALHDTSSATLLMVGAGVAAGRERWLAEQASRDLEVLSGPAVVSQREVDLVGMLREVLRHVPLRVSWRGPTAVPMRAVDAAMLCHGTREALTNVVRHAETDAAEVAVSVAGDSAGTVVVEVVDSGRGFAPDQVSDHRYGVARSIVERMTRIGGRATIDSSPGRGTTVRMECPRTAPDSGDDDVEMIATRFQRGLLWATVAINLVILLLLDLPKLLASHDTYRSATAQYLAMGGFVLLTLVVAAGLLRGRGIGRWRWPLVTLVFVLSAIATAAVPPDQRLGYAHWSEGNAGWTVVLLLLDTRPLVFVGVLAGHYLMTFAQTVLGGDAAITFAASVNATVLVLAFQLGVGMIAIVLRQLAITSARVARAEEEVRTTEAVAAQLAQDRRERYAELAETAVPLLSGLASGELDPGAESVRRSCAIEAAKMRRLFAEDATVPDPLLHELRACIELAERNGVSVAFAELGDRPAIPTKVRRRLTEAPIWALVTARGKVRLTVVGADGAVTVSVVAACPPKADPFPEGDGVHTSTTMDGDRLWIQSSWQGKS
ncbi:sensor histidine kinase [Plantactinospora soyae]|uniref:Signal transduction histidine kinase n=1 Tax=Plantactinospora soyae TaxID=1544732 RepID=A0A927R3I0_9ACTN|nr:ATP-binding protein [Plantactinospora soyae]MBE1485519.1 signal transduction histidine kinase [Plantactinospora soyae]